MGRFDDSALVSALVPVSAAAGVPGGNGLIGMRERAHVFGGSLDVGPAMGGGWRVQAKLPITSIEPLAGADGWSP